LSACVEFHLVPSADGGLVAESVFKGPPPSGSNAHLSSHLFLDVSSFSRDLKQDERIVAHSGRLVVVCRHAGYGGRRRLIKAFAAKQRS